jgi:hypothetical protein
MSIRKLSEGGPGPTASQYSYYNPRITLWFGPPGAPQLLGGADEIWLVENALTRGEFSPLYVGPPTAPPGVDGWRGDGQSELIWDGPYSINVRVDASINLGRATPPEVDGEIFMRKDGVEVAGATSSGSINRSPVGGQGSSQLSFTAFTTLNTGQSLSVKLRRIGAGAGAAASMNVYHSFVNISAIRPVQLPVQTIP